MDVLSINSPGNASNFDKLINSWTVLRSLSISKNNIWLNANTRKSTVLDQTAFVLNTNRFAQ